MLATQRRLTTDDIETLAAARRDRIARDRPQQLAERTKLVAALAVDPAVVKEQADLAAAVAAATRDVDAAWRALALARDRLSDAWRRQHGYSHGVNENDQAARAKLRETSHPAVGVVWAALIRAGYGAMATRASIVGIEDVKEEIPPSAEEARRGWFRPFVKETVRPVTSHNLQVKFLESLSAARLAVEGLAYQDLSDDDTLGKMRAELDTILRVQVPSTFWHVRDALVVLRQKLDADPMSVWAAVTEDLR